MFRRPAEKPAVERKAPERVDSVLGPGITWQGQVRGTGGIRIDGAFDGEIAIRGIVVVGEQGRVTCSHLRAVTVVVSGSLRGDITAYRVEITQSGRVWGDVITTSFSTEEGAFLRGNITMEDSLDLGFAEELPAEDEPDEEAPPEDADKS
jgi:cytoskeletal protein CcmA (bactofilin family)